MTEKFVTRFFLTALDALDDAARAAAAEVASAVVDAHEQSGKTIGQFADAIGWSRATLEDMRYGDGERRIGLRLLASLAAADPKVVSSDLRAAALYAAQLEVLRRCASRGGFDPTTYANLRRAEQSQ